MKQKIKPVEEVKIDEGIKLIGKDGKEVMIQADNHVVGTKPIRLSQRHPIQAINLFLPPGVSRFYVERLNKNEIRFLIRTEEVERLAEKAEKMMEAARKVDEKNNANKKVAVGKKSGEPDEAKA
ncbi:MAG: hypothetical protein WA019_04075 [Candidatus Moraniibacteriota bacterium]